MKILFLSYFVPYPPTAGHLQRNYNLIREIAKKHEVYLLTFTQKVLLPTQDDLDKSIEALRPLCRFIKVFPIGVEQSALRWYGSLFFNLFSPAPFTLWRFSSAELKREIKRLTSEVEFDVIHVDTIDLAQYISLAPDLPRLLNHHNVESMLQLRRSQGEKNPLAKIYLRLQARKLRRYEKKMLGRFDVNTCVSGVDIATYQEMAPLAKYELVANGSDTEYFTPRREQGGKRVIFAGGMSWHPNADAMVYFVRDILPIIHKTHPDIYCDIIGSHAPEELRTLAAAGKNVLIHGFVRDIRDYMAAAAVYIVPIRVGGGTRLKILDAFACGKAVVSTMVGCEGIDVTPEKDILIGDSPEEFAGQVIRLFEDEALQNTLAVNGRRLVEEKYSWAKIGDDLNRAYELIADTDGKSGSVSS
jgi:polysaccharide biosynthesis protein PslH